MKIRNGFVSNSSSSSFVLVGQRIKLSDINPKDLVALKNSERYMFETTLEGGEATIYGYINSPEMLEFLKRHENDSEELIRDVYEVFAFGYDSDEIDMNSIKVPRGKKAKIFTGTMEQYQISSVEEFKEQLGDDFEDADNTVIPNFVRLECTEDGHNKFYEMQVLNTTTFRATFGKIDSTGMMKDYPMDRWHEKYDEKIKEHYEEIERNED